MKAEVSKLVYEGKQVGTRITLVVGTKGKEHKSTPYYDIRVDVCKDIVSELRQVINEIILKSEPIQGSCDSTENYIVFRDDMYAVELTSLEPLMEKIKDLKKFWLVQKYLF